MKNSVIKTRTVFCRNLFRDDLHPDVLRPVAASVKIAEEGVRPLLNIDADHVLTSSLDATGILDMTSGEHLTLYGGSTRCACRCNGGKIIAFGEKGAVRIEPTDAGAYSQATTAIDEWPAIGITVEETSPLTMHIEPVKLGSAYVPGDNIAYKDRKAILESVNRAYRMFSAEAETGGLAFQPMLVRAVVKDREGIVLHRGPFRLVMSPKGVPFDLPVQIGTDGNAATAGADITVPTYRLRVTALPAAIQATAERGATLSLEMSPPLHTWSDDVADGTVTMSRFGVNSQPGFNVTLPGASTSLSVYDAGRSQRVIERTIAVFDAVKLEIPVCAAPFDRGCNISLAVRTGLTVGEHTDRLRKAFAALDTDNRHESSSVLHRLNAPHTFSAHLAAATAKAALYGNIDLLPYPGYTAADYAATSGANNAKWVSRTRVTYDDGATSTRVITGTGACPDTLDALIEHPDPTVTAMEITVGVEGESGARRWNILLQPDASGRHAVSVDSGLTPRQPVRVSLAPSASEPTQSRGAVRQPSLMAVATAAAPLTVTAVCDVGQPITALAVASSTSGAWDYGRTRFNAFTADRVMMVNVSSDFRTTAVGTIATCGVINSAAVTVSDSSKVFFLSGGGYVYSLSGSRVLILAKNRPGADILGYDPAANMLMASSSDGALDTWYIDTTTGESTLVTDTPGPFDAFFTAGRRVLVVGQQGLMDKTVRTASADEKIDIRMVSEMPVRYDGQSFSPARVIWNVDSPSFEGSATLLRTSLADRHAPVTSFRINGRIGSPVPMTVYTRTLTAARLELEGRVSADTTVSAPTVQGKERR